MEQIKKLAQGLMLTGGLALVSWFAASHVPYVGKVTMALLLGIVIGNLVPLGKGFDAGVRYSERTLLAWAIALMGLTLDLGKVVDMGWQVAVVVIPTMAVVMAAALLVGRLLGSSRSMSLLIGTGNAVCGSSAIAAVAPGVGAKESEIGISIGVINFLGTVGLLCFPPLALAMGFSDQACAYLMGGGLQAVGHVAGAGATIDAARQVADATAGDHVTAMAILVKMLRVLMLVVLVVVTPLLAGRKRGEGHGKAKLVPAYLIGFVAFSIVASLPLTFLSGPIGGFKTVGSILLTVAMAAIGLRIRFVELIHQAPKALLAGVLVWVAQMGFLLLVIRLLAV